jgi:hypothetical protein
LYQEIAFIAYYLHWSHQEIMELEHRQRRRWCEEISRINSQLSQSPENIFAPAGGFAPNHFNEKSP